MSPIVGVLGAGQLGRMLALAAAPLGLRVRCFDAAEPEADAPPAAQVCDFFPGDFADEDGLRRFAEGCAAVTYEFENVPARAAEVVAQVAPLFPPVGALEAAQDRVSEKTLLNSLGVATPAWAEVNSRADLDTAASIIGLPAVLKTRRFGYDGKGQAVLRAPIDVGRAWADLGIACDPGGHGLILEAFAPFEREVSILGIRGRPDGTGRAPTAFYPLIENRHEGGILRLSRIGAAASAAPERNALHTQAQAACARLMESLGYVGVCCIEFFQVRDERGAPALLANEMACRVHNSGHWTIEGARTSQFENHLRAIMGWPPGSTEPRGPCAMVNLIGATPPIHEVLAIEDAHPHLYGKRARPGRKLGHITVLAPDEGTLDHRLRRLRAAMGC